MVIRKEVFQIIPVVLLLLTEELFMPFSFDQKYEGINATIYENVVILSKVFALLAFSYAAIGFFKLGSIYRISIFLISVLFVFMIFESQYYYRSLFEFPPVFIKSLMWAITLSVFFYYYDKKRISIVSIVLMISFGLIMKIAINPSMLTVYAFITHDRGIPSESAYLLTIPLLYFFNRYMTENRNYFLIGFLIFAGFLFFFQHRTVWVASFFSFIINLILLRNKQNVDFGRLTVNIIPISIVVFIFSLLILTYSPDMKDKISQNVDEILNPNTEETTASWRLEQIYSYIPFVAQKPFFGWRLKGYELPVQFYNEDIGKALFSKSDEMLTSKKSGHHFHNFYLDQLFYFGIFGLVFSITMILYPLVSVLKNKVQIDADRIAVISFTASGLIYSFGYRLPNYYWVFLGLSLVFVYQGIRKTSKPI